MTLAFLGTGARSPRRISRRVSRDLSPHRMRDIGLDPWRDRAPASVPPLW